MQENNEYKITGLKLPAFIKMDNSMYEEQEVKEQEANFKKIQTITSKYRA